MSEDKADTLVNRLRGQYSVGENNEFGTRSFADFIPPIGLEAANRIEEMQAILNETNEYLNTNNLTSIGHGSILHTKIKQFCSDT